MNQPLENGRGGNFWGGYGAFAVIAVVVFLIHSDGVNLFSRDLIRLDDLSVIAPFKELGIRRYFTEWLWQKDNYAFPFRDVFYILDFEVEKLLNIKVFLLQNILWFLIYGFLFFRISARYLSGMWASVCTALLLFHPVNSQVVQWASSRKHLMTAVLTLLMIEIVTRVAFGNASTALKTTKGEKISQIPEPRLRLSHFVGIFFLQVAASLSYASGNLAFVAAAAFAFVLFPSQKREIFVFCGITGLVTAGIASFFVANNSDFSQSTSTIGGSSNDILNMLLSFGRMVWNLVFPNQPAIYYAETSVLNLFGVGLMIALLWGIGFWFVRATPETKKRVMPFMLAALMFGLPQVAFILGRHEFLPADRYLFLLVPYVIWVVVLLASEALRRHVAERDVPSKRVRVALGVVGAWCLLLSLRSVPEWRNASDLFKSCVANEKSTYCWHMILETEYNRAGCQAAYPYFDPAHSLLKEIPDTQIGKSLRADLPLYESLCISTMQGIKVEERFAMLKNLETQHGSSPGYSFGETLLLLEMGKLADASLVYGEATVGSVGQTLTRLYDLKVLLVYFGAAQVMCENVPAMKEFCRSTLWPLMSSRVTPENAKQATVSTAAALTAGALSLGLKTQELGQPALRVAEPKGAAPTR